MKNKLLFYFVGATLLVCSTGTFTSCVNGVDDEYLELVNNGGSGNSNEEDETAELPDLNGDYVAGGELELSMTYNGEELTGKAVNVAADEGNETATITLMGTEQDLSEMVGGLMEFKFTTFSPVPGLKEIILSNVKLYNSGTSYLFKGEDIQPTYTLSYEGTIENGKMDIDLKHVLSGDNPLKGTWKLAESVTTGDSPKYAPLWFECNSQVKVNLGKINLGIAALPINQPIQGIVSLLTGSMSGMIMNGILGQNIQVEQLVLKMLQDLTAEETGGIFATYNYAKDSEGKIDFNNPQWSSNMSHNILRYYYGEEQGKFFVEVNTDFLMNTIGGLIPSIAANTPITRAGDPEQTKKIGRELIEMLIPLLRDGIPCEYSFDSVTNGELAINIEGETLRKLLLKILELANDEYAKEFVNGFIESSLGDFAENIKLLLQNAPAGLTYHDGTSPEDYSGECGPAKLGLKFTK